ncbi:sugar ABC transporter substrate-binding protein [Streptomyces sp. NPDC059010]|uniref:sugar ABC transporter substrate-binding protein n=1 Tax=Streptomyces sp. NPDC059010 TaxID=3346695 RepID=UPI0036A90ADD
MNIRTREAVVATAVSLTLGLGACGQAGESVGSSSGEGGLSIGLLLPEKQTARYEQSDRPLITEKIKELCGRCTVKYANAHDDTAVQRQQMESMINRGVDVLILDAVDIRGARSMVKEAKDAGVPVIAYDRPVEGPITAYVSHDPVAIGRFQGEALLRAQGARGDGGRVVRVDGPQQSAGVVSPFDSGAQSVLKGKVEISKVYRAETWNTGSAYVAMSGAIAAEGTDIDGVWAGNDVIAGGVIAALKDARVRPLPLVVGQDAELPAVQRIVSGEQAMTVYKPYPPEAEAAARFAVAVGRGEDIDRIAEDEVDISTAKDVPAVLITPIPLTAQNIKDTVVKDGMYTIDQICTPRYRPACERAGLTG